MVGTKWKPFIEAKVSKTIKKQMTESSKDILLLAKNKKIKELYEEVKKIKAGTYVFARNNIRLYYPYINC